MRLDVKVKLLPVIKPQQNRKIEKYLVLCWETQTSGVGAHSGVKADEHGC